MRYLSHFSLTLLTVLTIACQRSASQPASQPVQEPKVAIQNTATPFTPPKLTGAPAATPTVVQGARRGGTLVVALNADPDTLNADLSFGSTSLVGCKIADGLVSTSADQTQIRPELATGWEISPDGRTYTLHLRQGVLWHDGKPFTSEDVKWSFENLSKFHPISGRWIATLESIQTPDPYTIVLKLKEPFAPLLTSLTCGNGSGVFPKHAVAAGADPRKDKGINQAPIGTGPFVFKEAIPGDRIVLVRNEKYWKAGLPYLDQVIFKIIPDPSSRALSLRAGEVNRIERQFVDRADAVRLQNDPNTSVVTGIDTPALHMVQFNFRRPPFDKPEVRKALFMALDRNLLLTSVYKGFGQLQENLINNRLAVAADPEVNLLQMYPYDVAKANRMLDDAGLPRNAGGSRFQVKLLYETGRSEWNEVAQVVAASWDQVGVKVTIEPTERAVMVDRVFKKRDFDTTLQTYASLGDPALGVSRIFVCEADKDAISFGNPTGYCRKDVDQLFQEAEQTTDFEARRAVYRKVQKLLAEDLSVIPFMGAENVTLVDKQFDYAWPHDSFGVYSGWEYVYKLQ